MPLGNETALLMQKQGMRRMSLHLGAVNVEVGRAEWAHWTVQSAEGRSFVQTNHAVKSDVFSSSKTETTGGAPLSPSSRHLATTWS
jgi:hypothetical protein